MTSHRTFRLLQALHAFAALFLGGPFLSSSFPACELLRLLEFEESGRGESDCEPVDCAGTFDRSWAEAEAIAPWSITREL
jgi:hypothetical protein